VATLIAQAAAGAADR